jgi:hypothetical protein
MTTEMTDRNVDNHIPGLSKSELKTLQKSFVHRRWLGKYLILKQFVEKFERGCAKGVKTVNPTKFKPPPLIPPPLTREERNASTALCSLPP